MDTSKSIYIPGRRRDWAFVEGRKLPGNVVTEYKANQVDHIKLALGAAVYSVMTNTKVDMRVVLSEVEEAGPAFRLDDDDMCDLLAYASQDDA